MERWARKRNPDDVPTPVAVAVSDFCRRAGSPAAASEVRAALALLSDDEDFRVRAIAEQEPTAQALGPFAVIDLARGSSPELAVERQRCGYYELVRELADERSAPALPAAQFEASPKAPTFAAPPLVPAPAPAPTMAERIGPTKRVPHPNAPEPEPTPAPESGKRELPQPRGRFTRLAAPKQPGQTLLEPASADLLKTTLEQHAHRMALLKVLSGQFAGIAGPILTLEDVETALRHHGLLVSLERIERDRILAAYTEHKGAGGRVAWALGVTPAELTTWVRALSLESQVQELRERFKRDALAPNGLAYRLDLLGRSKYLSDLGIQKRFKDALTQDLRGLLKASESEVDDLPALMSLVGKKYAAAPELIARAMDRLGLTAEFKKRRAPEGPPSPS